MFPCTFDLALTSCFVRHSAAISICEVINAPKEQGYGGQAGPKERQGRSQGD